MFLCWTFPDVLIFYCRYKQLVEQILSDNNFVFCPVLTMRHNNIIRGIILKLPSRRNQIKKKKKTWLKAVSGQSAVDSACGLCISRAAFQNQFGFYVQTIIDPGLIFNYFNPTVTSAFHQPKKKAVFPTTEINVFRVVC